MKSCTVENVTTVDGNLATCDPEGCCVMCLSVHAYEMTGYGALGLNDGRTTQGEESHFCPDHPQRFHG